MKTREGPERRCIATGESRRTDRMVRFVLSPEGEAVPDLSLIHISEPTRPY